MCYPRLACIEPTLFQLDPFGHESHEIYSRYIYFGNLALKDAVAASQPSEGERGERPAGKNPSNFPMLALSLHPSLPLLHFLILAEAAASWARATASASNAKSGAGRAPCCLSLWQMAVCLLRGRTRRDLCFQSPSKAEPRTLVASQKSFGCEEAPNNPGQRNTPPHPDPVRVRVRTFPSSTLHTRSAAP